MTDEERRIVRERLESERRPREVRHFGVAIRDPRVIILSLVVFGFLVGSYAVGIFLPLMLREVRDLDAVGARHRAVERREAAGEQRRVSGPRG
ncbi:hypothetical protein B4Q13_16720 [Lacticaseibacillus rhamnosus]